MLEPSAAKFEVPSSPRVRLAIRDLGSGPIAAVRWVGPLVALGGMAQRYARQQTDRQLVVAVSLPRRAFAAVLVASGWVVTARAPATSTPTQRLAALESGTPIRLVTEREVILDEFVGLDERGEGSVRLRNTRWLLPMVRAVAEARDFVAPARSVRPAVGSLARWAGLEDTWDERLAAQENDLAIVGTVAWLRRDLSALVTVVPNDDDQGDSRLSTGEPVDDRIESVVLPSGEGSATSFARLYSSSRLADLLPLPSNLRCAILDGTGAIKYASEVEAPVVVCLLDRSVGDETAAEILIQLRNSRGEPSALKESIGWRPPAGIEAMAYTVPL